MSAGAKLYLVHEEVDQAARAVLLCMLCLETPPPTLPPPTLA